MNLNAQEIIARYDFTNDFADAMGRQGALTPEGGAQVQGGELVLQQLTDTARILTIPNSDLYVSGIQALEIEAKIKVTAFKGYSVANADIIRLYNGWDAYMGLMHDKWGAAPAALVGAGRQVAAANIVKPYLTLGTEHHLRLVLDVNQARLWIDGRLVNTVTATGDLAKWARPGGNTSLNLGAFEGTLDDVVLKRFTTIPDYPDAAQFPTITSLVWHADGSVEVTWDSTPGAFYTLETSLDNVNWTAQVDTVTQATQLSTTLTVQPANEGPFYVRVSLGNAFAGQGPMIISHQSGERLVGSSATFRWMANELGVEEWQVLAGSSPGGSQYFQSYLIPGSSSQYPVTGLPTRGENVHISLRYRKGSLWAEKRFVFQAALTDSLPEEREGIFPIAQPEYHGIEQILILSDRWIIAAVTDIDEVLQELNTLSSGNFANYVQMWMGSEPAGNPPNWTGYTQSGAARNTYLAQARQNLNEDRYIQPSFFAISSPDDAGYASTQPPLTATQYYVGLDKGQFPGAPPLHYAHYCYLQLPQAMVSGKHYTVTLANGKSATFLYDEMRSVSRAIKVNQAGYLPDAGKKFAYLGAHVYGFGPLPLTHTATFQVIHAETGTVALTGPVTLREANPRFAVNTNNPDPATRPLMHGEDLYEIDLSGLTEVGNFFITVPGVGRSWTFRHHPDAYGEAFYISARGLFHQRASMQYALPFTSWSRIKAHTDPIFESSLVAFGFGLFNPPANYQIFDVVGGSTRYDFATTNVLGGWYDAADWDRNLRHYTCIFDLLYAYELAPGKFVDGGLNIPESGNGIPDVLDEAEYGLEVWTRSMTAAGGVSGHVETFTHPSMTDPTVKYAYSQRTRWSSLIYAAAAAQFAELVAPFDAAKSALYLERAERAFGYGNDPANSLGTTTIPAKTNRGAGTPYSYVWTEQDSYIQPYLFHAKLRLYLLTQNPAYLTNIEQHLAQGATPWQWPNSYKDCVGWFFFPIASRGTGILSQSLVDAWKQKFINEGNMLLGQLENMGYRHTWPRYQDYWMAWGESNMANRGRVLLQAYALSQDVRYRDTAICNMDYMFGANPMGMSWTTGIGFVYPTVIQHSVSETDAIDDPVPGITLYGLDGGTINYSVRNNAWSSPADTSVSSYVSFYTDPVVPFYRRWSAHPSLNVGQCEFTIHETVSATLFSCAMLAPEGYQPPASLKERRPRHKSLLYGYWYLP